MLKTIIIFLLLLRFSVPKLIGVCHQCFASNNVACLNENQFSTCFQGSATPTITTCPDRHVCTDDVRICRPIEEGYEPICANKYCGECEITNGIFTCLDKTTYGYCFGDKIPIESTLRSCPSKFVCNYDYREICVPEEMYEASCAAKANSTGPTDSTTEFTTDETTMSTIIEQTSPTTEMTTETEETATAEITTTEETTLTAETTTELSTLTIPTAEITITQGTSSVTETTSKPEPKDADTICGQIGKTGYFKSADVNCRQYVYCYLLSGQYLGWFYYCDFYFNSATQKCQKERPSNCVPY